MEKIVITCIAIDLSSPAGAVSNAFQVELERLQHEILTAKKLPSEPRCVFFFAGISERWRLRLKPYVHICSFLLAETDHIALCNPGHKMEI